MEIKLFTAPYKITLLTFFISIVVYLILGLIIVKILDKMANYKPRKSFVIIGIIISYLVELLVVRVLFFAVRAVIDILIVLIWIIKYYFQAWFSITFNLH